MRRGKILALVTAVFLGSSGVALAAGVTVEDATDEQRKAASEAFEAGDAAFDVLNYAKALEHFRKSYDAVASPNSRLMVARSLLELGRLDEAYDEYSGVVADASDKETYAAAGHTAEKERAALLNRLAWMELDLGNVPDSASLKIGGRDRALSVVDEPIALTPGLTVVEATTKNGTTAHAKVHAAAGRKVVVKLEVGKSVTVGTPPPPNEVEEPQEVEEYTRATPAPRPERKGPPLLPGAIVAGGVGLAGAGVFAAFGILSGKHYSDLESDCTDGLCPPESQQDIDKGKRYQLIANIGLGMGIAGVATSTVLCILHAKRRKGPIEVNLGYKTVSVRGEF